MASEFQRRKVSTVFDAMDVDRNGFLERDDFVALTVRWTGVRNWPPGSDGHRKLSAIMMGWWSALESAAGPERPGQVRLEDVLRVVDQLGLDPAPVVATAAAMFDAVDENGDGSVSPAEYRQLMETWTGRSVDTDETFRLLDRDGDGSVSVAEFTAAWQEFWAGDDPAEPGSWLFGRFPLPVG